MPLYKDKYNFQENARGTCIPELTESFESVHNKSALNKMKQKQHLPLPTDPYRHLIPLLIILIALNLTLSYVLWHKLNYRSLGQTNDTSKSIKFGTFEAPPTTPAYEPAAPAYSGPLPITTPAIGGPVPPADYYCIDDEDPDMCDDNTSHLVPKGAGGVAGSCGTVISQAHRLVMALPQYMKGLRDKLTTAISNCGYSTGPADSYVSTHFVIDAYNLAGIPGLNKTDPAHVSPSGLYNWWQSPPAGYLFVPYSTAAVQEYATGQRDLTGCVMFLTTSSSYHIGIVNKLELFTAQGDGVISILQAGTSMYIDRFPVANWNISNSSTNMTYTSGVAGFGCYQ